jgi:signal transduction histidine kinase
MYLLIYLSTVKILYSHYDVDLLTEFGEVSTSMSIQDGRVYVLAQPEWTEREHGEATVSPIFLQATDTTGAVLRTSPNLRDTRLQFDAGRTDTFVVSRQLGTTWIRQVQGPIISRQGDLEGYLLIGMGIAEAKLLLDYLMWIMLLSFPVLVGVIIIISRWFGASIVRPISTLIATADHISRENLDERVRLPKNPDELRHLSITVNNLLDRLQELILREQTFAADAAHELRTPLAVVKGTLEVLIRQPREPKYYEERLKYCIAEIDRMSGLVDQLLLMAKYESGEEKLRFVEIDVAQCLAGVLERLDVYSRSKRIALQLAFAQGAVVNSDLILLTTVLDNVISNAIKYSPESAVIAIGVIENTDAITVTVKDQGPGMTQEQIAKVFDRFYRVESENGMQTKGFGLGLALVRRLAELLKIEVTVKSAVDEGTLFHLAIPKH